MTTRVIGLLAVVLMVTATTMPAAATPQGDAFTRTECVIATGPPVVTQTGRDGHVLHIRDFPYLGSLSDGTGQPGTNSGLVDIDLNLATGTGSIRGTLTVRDEEMGDFDGRFSGHYKDGVWVGRGAAIGVNDDVGKLLKMELVGLDPVDACGPEDYWQDAAAWEVVISGG
jgi:hypothetical protein